MASPSGSSELAIRARLYVAFLTIGLLVAFVGAIWSIQGHSIPAVDTPVIVFVSAAAALLLWLRPLVVPLVLGVLCIVLAVLGFWLASPDGGWMANYLLHDPNDGPYAGHTFGFLFLLFPVGWILLGVSVADWKLAVGSYLLLGIIFCLLGILFGWFGPPGYGYGQIPPLVFFAFPLLWPQWILIMLGTFGRTFG